MKDKPTRGKLQHLRNDDEDKDNPEGYPPYPPGEDIYGQYHKDRSRNPEDPTSIKETFNRIYATRSNEKDFTDDFSGSDLDIPGSELDDELELIGSEDEENNYYSLGGDDHNDLEEDYVE